MEHTLSYEDEDEREDFDAQEVFGTQLHITLSHLQCTVCLMSARGVFVQR